MQLSAKAVGLRARSLSRAWAPILAVTVSPPASAPRDKAVSLSQGLRVPFLVWAISHFLTRCKACCVPTNVAWTLHVSVANVSFGIAQGLNLSSASCGS